MEQLVVYKTDRGKYAVRPINWVGIWNEKGQIQESLNHLALFIEKEDAEKFIEWKMLEEQNKLLKLPCAVGDKLYEPRPDRGMITEYIVNHIGYAGEFFQMFIGCKLIPGIYRNLSGIHESSIGKTVFFTREEAENALKELTNGNLEK